MTSSARAGQQRPRGRANGEGSIFPYRNGYAAYVWVTTPAWERKRKYVYGKTREIVYGKWIELQAKAARAPVPTVTPTLETYLSSWLAEVIKPNRELATYDQHEILTRLYIVPSLGEMKVDRLRVRQVQTWLNNLAATCQCCAQGKDARRPKGKRRCCAAGQCCESYPGKRTVQAARNTLRAALSQAVVDEIVPRNVASLVQVPTLPKRRRKGSSWSVQEAAEVSRMDQDHGKEFRITLLNHGMRRKSTLISAASSSLSSLNRHAPASSSGMYTSPPRRAPARRREVVSRAHVRPGVGGGRPGRHALVVRHVEVVVEVAPVRGVPREAGPPGRDRRVAPPRQVPGGWTGPAISLRMDSVSRLGSAWRHRCDSGGRRLRP